MNNKLHQQVHKMIKENNKETNNKKFSSYIYLICQETEKGRDKIILNKFPLSSNLYGIW